MNPIVLDLGPLELHAYSAWLGGGILFGLGLILMRAHAADPNGTIRWLDVGIAAVLSGLVGARLLHVALGWAYFRDHQNEIMRLKLGGLDWHGALLAGLPAAWLTARWRRVPFGAWADAAALAWPAGMMADWIACRESGCAYGYEVRTLADWPGWLVEELPDIYGLAAPRLDVQLFGVVLSFVLLLIMAIITWRDRLRGVRLWLALALTGLLAHLLGYFRADPAQTYYNRRDDQILDVILLFTSTLIGGAIWLVGRRAVTRGVRWEDSSYENQAGAGPDRAEVR